MRAQVAKGRRGEGRRGRLRSHAQVGGFPWGPGAKPALGSPLCPSGPISGPNQPPAAWCPACCLDPQQRLGPHPTPQGCQANGGASLQDSTVLVAPPASPSPALRRQSKWPPILAPRLQLNSGHRPPVPQLPAATVAAGSSSTLPGAPHRHRVRSQLAGPRYREGTNLGV